MLVFTELFLMNCVLKLCGVRCAKFEVDAWMAVSENSQIMVWKFHNRTRWKYNEILKLSSLRIYETQNSEKFLNKCWVVCLFKKFYKYCCLYFTGRLKRNIKMFSDFIYESYKMALLLLGITRSSRLPKSQSGKQLLSYVQCTKLFGRSNNQKKSCWTQRKS